MKKFGFTLSEILVALGIIGVVSAITVPMLGNLIPDQDKIKVLKCYKTIVDITNEIINDPSLYWTPNSAEAQASGVSVDCTGLECTQKPNIEAFNSNDYEGKDKFPNLFFGYLDHSDYQTKDNIFWQNEIEENREYYIVTVDLNGEENGPNAVFSSTEKKPDRFIFRVNFDGRVMGFDPLTKAYLKNANSLNDKKNDYKEAEKML